MQFLQLQQPLQNVPSPQNSQQHLQNPLIEHQLNIFPSSNLDLNQQPTGQNQFNHPSRLKDVQTKIVQRPRSQLVYPQKQLVARHN